MPSWGQAVALDASQVLPVPMRVLPVPSWGHWGQVVALQPPQGPPSAFLGTSGGIKCFSGPPGATWGLPNAPQGFPSPFLVTLGVGGNFKRP